MLGGAEFLLSTVSPYQNAKKKVTSGTGTSLLKNAVVFFPCEERLVFWGRKMGLLGVRFLYHLVSRSRVKDQTHKTTREAVSSAWRCRKFQSY